MRQPFDMEGFRHAAEELRNAGRALEAAYIDEAAVEIERLQIDLADEQDRVRCLGDEIVALRKESEWQPIETAPKDGTEVLVWRSDAGVTLARYTSMSAFLSEQECEKHAADDLDQDDWFAADFVQGCRMDGDLSPTHWMPLPAGPEGAGR